MLFILLVIIFSVYYQQSVFCFEGELTVIIEAGTKDCFYQFAKVGDTIDVEYQVIDGGHGDLDISFQLIEPTGRYLISDFKRSENVHRLKAIDEGNYAICFDNTFSTFNKKTVFFEIVIENDDENGKDNSDNNDELTPEETYEIKIQDIMDYVTRIRNQLTKSRQLQDMIKSQEARDRNIVEENFFRVNTWSIFQICFMLIVGALQVYMVRSIFETDCKVNAIFKKLNF